MIIANGVDYDKYRSAVKIEKEIIELVSTFKYLGIVIDRNLSFSDHIDYLVKKIGKKIGFIRTCKYLSEWCIRTVYNTIIEPYFIYCSSILFLCNKTDLAKLQILQNKAVRLILIVNVILIHP